MFRTARTRRMLTVALFVMAGSLASWQLTPNSAAAQEAGDAALIGTWEGEYVFPNGNEGDSTLIVDSIDGDTAQTTIEWRWPVQNSDSRTYTANVIRNSSGEIIGLEPWGGSVLDLEGNRLVGDLELRVGTATHRYAKR